MSAGPGKYDPLCTLVREQADAQGVVLIVLNGHHGCGFSVQATEDLAPQVLADLLQQVVDKMRMAWGGETPTKAEALMSLGKAAGALADANVRQEVIDSLRRGELTPHYLAHLRNKLDDLLQAARQEPFAP